MPEALVGLHMIGPCADRPIAITLGADKAYDAEDFVNEAVRERGCVLQQPARQMPGHLSTGCRLDGKTARTA
jgi:hypothetical protein